jgi:hypothetical protein
MTLIRMKTQSFVHSPEVRSEMEVQLRSGPEKEILWVGYVRWFCPVSAAPVDNVASNSLVAQYLYDRCAAPRVAGRVICHHLVMTCRNITVH